MPKFFICGNESKKEEQGQLEEENLLWGFHMHLNNMTIRLPEPKCVKATYMLAQPELQPGIRKVRSKAAHEVRGFFNFAALPSQDTAWSVSRSVMYPSNFLRLPLMLKVGSM